MTRFVLQEALGSETQYNNLIHGALTADLDHSSTAALKLFDMIGNIVTIAGQNIQVSVAPPGISSGTVQSISVTDSSAVALLTINQFPPHSSAKTFFDNFVAHGLGGLFTSLNSGNDVFVGNSFANTMNGGNGRDRLTGGAGADSLSGGAGADTVVGGDDNDTLAGGAAGDSLSGGTGDDSILGGTGDDILSGGAGFDRFVFRSGDGADTITDFKATSSDPQHLNQDHIVVTQVLRNNFETHLVLDAVTSAVLGVEVDFFNTSHAAQGSIFLQNVLTLAAITTADFIVG